MKAFVTSQFSYFPLIWTFLSRELNKRINRIHERALMLNRINRMHEWALMMVYQDNSSLVELLEKDSSVTIHQRNLRIHQEI